jgi:hypothetical protein
MNEREIKIQDMLLTIIESTSAQDMSNALQNYAEFLGCVHSRLELEERVK